jgi:hypothetical protein
MNDALLDSWTKLQNRLMIAAPRLYTTIFKDQVLFERLVPIVSFGTNKSNIILSE